MSVKVESTEKNVIQLEFEVEPEKFEEGLQKSFFKNAKNFNVPGFRKGKAPRKIIESHYGEHVFYEDAIDFVCSDVYYEAVKEQGLHPVDQPNIDIKQVGKGETFIFTAKVTVKPDVVLGQYKGIEVKKFDSDVTDEDVDAELNKVVQKNARIITVDDKSVESGDLVNIDFAGSIDGVAFEGGTAKGYDLMIGSGHFIPGFEEQLIGAKIGEEVDVNVVFPEDYASEELAGKDALFKVIVNKISVKQLPEIDDEFAKDVSEFDTLAEYKDNIKKELKELKEKTAKREFEDKVLMEIANNAQVDIPEVMIERQSEKLMHDFELRLKVNGLNLETYFEIMHQDVDGFMKDIKERAEKEVKFQLVLEKISEVENISATDDDINEEIKLIAEEYDKSLEDLRKTLKEEDLFHIKSSVVMRKTIDMLIADSKAI